MSKDHVTSARPDPGPHFSSRARSEQRTLRRGLRWATLTLLVGSVAATSFAKISVPYGEDGAPPDSGDQAAADALNDALDGPDQGQSTQDWLEELEAAHEAVYGTGIFTSTSNPPGVDCSVVDDENGAACDGGKTWVHYSDPYDLVQSTERHCPYKSYVDCLQAGESVDYCKHFVLNCHDGALTKATASISFDARQCNDKPCICGKASGDITLVGTSFIDGDQVCLDVESYSYDGTYDQYVDPEIVKWLDANDWEICMPLACVEG